MESERDENRSGVDDRASKNDRVTWEIREDRESNVGLLDFGNELNHCVESEDDYMFEVWQWCFRFSPNDRRSPWFCSLTGGV